MHTAEQNLRTIENKVKEIIDKKQLKTSPEIIAVTKTWSMDEITPLLEMGHIHFGENKIQEAEQKWLDVKLKYQNLKLHMLGKLQSNKAKKAVKLFDYIHSLDDEKLANKIFYFERELNKKVKLFIQVNISRESQKSGVLINELDSFYNYCTKELSLDVIGLMCLPLINSDVSQYFNELKIASSKLNLKNLSMGMSADYEQAVLNG